MAVEGYSNADWQAGTADEGSYSPTQLFTAEDEIKTSEGTYKNNQNVAVLTILALDSANQLVPWDPTDDISAVQATGSISLQNAAPAANDTVTINGVAITFVTSGATGAQVLRGADASAAATNLRTYINANPGSLHVTAGGSAGSVLLTATDPGDDGNAVTLAKSFATPANGTVSGATLTGGYDAADNLGLKSIPVGVAAADMNTTSGGLNAATWGPYYVSACFNPDLLVWPAGLASANYEAKKAALERARAPFRIKRLL